MSIKVKRIFLVIGILFALSVPVHVDAADHFIKVQSTLRSEQGTSSNGDFITGALGSLDENTAAQESNENYMRNFYNSTQTVMTEGLNLFRPHTIVMTLLNVITMLLELLGSVITFFVMVLYNFVSSTFMMTVVDTILKSIESVVFNWSDYNSWIIKVVVLVTLVGILYQLIKNFTKLHGYKQIMQVILSGFLSMFLIIFIGQNGRKIMFSMESLAQDVLVETFVFVGQSENMEIANKENIYEIMQLQPFMLRHFGTVSYDAIAASANQSKEDAETRVQTLLDDPTENNARIELNDFNNTAISHDIASCSQVLFLSFMGLVHRGLIGLVIAILAIGVGIVKLLKVLLMFLSVYQLLWWMIRRTHRARQWFLDRMTWSILSIGVDLLFNIAMYFVMEACVKVSAIHPLLMIAFDVLLLVLCIYAAKNISTIGAKLRESGEILQAALVGQSPSQSFSHLSGKNSQTSIDSANEESSVSEDGNYLDETESESLNQEDLSDQDNDIFNDEEMNDGDAADEAGENAEDNKLFDESTDFDDELSQSEENTKNAEDQNHDADSNLSEEIDDEEMVTQAEMLQGEQEADSGNTYDKSFELDDKESDETIPSEMDSLEEDTEENLSDIPDNVLEDETDLDLDIIDDANEDEIESDSNSTVQTIESDIDSPDASDSTNERQEINEESIESLEEQNNSQEEQKDIEEETEMEEINNEMDT